MTKQERHELTVLLEKIKEASDYLCTGRINDGRINVDIVEAALEAILSRKK
ncbi:hypothetical protein KKJ06_17290 [Xenorhabdus bovienii]|uniref:hypothetical protein n=1 Tax=Xenorhabdus bovienii TaxID=40576 RepID=UPI0023B212F9|nr:hypothetical protein [Xenorhabdus bovienii]MDE9540377.1 hypothetical protein [Xenorhabdus bovienii]MDE9557128.1 hypothetical protein [Xenorhabdus bovienii]